MSSGRHAKAVVANLAAVAAGLAIALVAGELMVRTIAPQNLYRFPQGMFVIDEQLGYRLADNFADRISTTEYHTAITTNEQGLRETSIIGDKSRDAFRILALGDSFTMGVGVESKESFPKQLEAMLDSRYPSIDISVINAGVPGYDTATEVDYFIQDGVILQPDLVLLGLYVGNDIVDNVTGIETTVIDGFLRNPSPGRGKLPVWLRDTLQRRSHLYRFLWPLQRRLLNPEFADEQLARARHSMAPYDVSSSRIHADMWSATFAQLRRFNETARRHGIPSAVIIIPESVQVDRGRWQDRIDGLGRPADAAYGHDVPQQILNDYCASLGIDTLDLLPGFMAQPDQRDLYFDIDNHWTVSGNRIAAESLFNALIAHPRLEIAALHSQQSEKMAATRLPQ